MSGKEILRQFADESTGQSFQLYNELFDEEGDVYLELEGFPFEAATSISISVNSGQPHLVVRLPREWAQKLGLIRAEAEHEEARPEFMSEDAKGVIAHAESIFGDKKSAFRWLRKPKLRFQGRSPLDMLSTEAGAKLVEEMLIQLEEGMFA